MDLAALSRPCPCGSGSRYDDCCGPLLRGERVAATAVELMRSRYSAYAVRDLDYVFRTWHPRTRPSDLTGADEAEWLGLEILAVDAGNETDEDGTVEFCATYRVPSGSADLHEVSTFGRRGGRWVYVHGKAG